MSTTEPVDTSDATDAYPKYDEYVDSGVEWLGEIPKQWDVLSLKYAAQIVQDKLDEKPEALPYLGLEHIESETGRLVKEEPSEDVSSTVRHFKEGDVLFSKLRPYLAKVYLAETEGVGTTELIALRSKTDVCERYIAYQLLSKGFIDRVDSMTYGAKMPRVSPEQVGSRQIALPSLAEQRAIARFLDRETGRIDALIEKKERLIDLLEEKRTALISRVVTEGLDRDVEMQDSGVEWLGEIPMEWDTAALKYLVRFVNGATFDSSDWQSEGVPIIRISNLNEDTEFNHVDPDKEVDGKYHVREGDLLFGWSGNRGTSFGPHIWNKEGLHYLNQHIFKIENYDLSTEYLYWILEAVTHYVEQEARGTIHMVHITKSDLGSTKVPVVSDSEQRALAEYLNRKTNQIDQLIEEVSRGIEKLREYRTALISAAVTGQIDVCEEVSTVPAE